MASKDLMLFRAPAVKKDFGRRQKTIVLGWSDRIFPLLDELAIAPRRTRKAKVTIMSDLPVEQARAAILARVQQPKKLSLELVTGDPTLATDLGWLNLEKSRAIVILDPESHSDAFVVSTVFALRALKLERLPKVIAEVGDARTAEAITTGTGGQVVTIRSRDVSAKLIAQSSRQPGLASVFLDLLDFSGDEIYFTPVPALDGKEYGEALLSFNTASVIGIQTPEGDVMLNPRPNTKIQKGSRLISIALDDTKVHFTGIREELVGPIPKPKKAKPEPENILVIGWSETGRLVLKDLGASLPKGSSIHVVVQKDLAQASLAGEITLPSDVNLTVSISSDPLIEVQADICRGNLTEILVLGYRDAMPKQDADAQTILTLVQLRSMLEASESGNTKPRMVAELLDGKKSAIAQEAGNPDLIVGDDLAAFLIAQLSNDPSLAVVFDELFGSGGSSLVISDIALYAEIGKEVSYAQLVANARARGESAIGYHRAEIGSQAVPAIVNPDKDTMFTPKPTDGLVVVADTVR